MVSATKAPKPALLLAVALALPGCATIQREYFTEAQQEEATIPGIPAARFWADAPDAARRMSAAHTGPTGEKAMLALSSGSDNGAYGAGLLKGWSESGRRPEFSIVTGVSTGALIAPFAFLGSDQDATLERLFTSLSPREIYRARFPLAIPASPSAATTKRLARLIASVMPDTLIDRIGTEHLRGRRLLVGTANLDAQRMVVWDMGAIAASKAPGRYLLFRQVLLASSAIPAFFPPVMIHTEISGRSISEMHVDGGTTAQIFTMPDDAITGDRPLAGPRPLHLYLIVNNKLNGEFRLTKPRIIPIAARSISLNMRSSMGGSIGLSYLYAKARGIDFNMSFIAREYPDQDHALFDTAYMRGLFDHGAALGRTGDFWTKRPPNEDE